jgi:polar amino acid transport system substrate-binding protein
MQGMTCRASGSPRKETSMARRHTLTYLAGIAVAGLALSACGSSSLTPTATTAASKAAGAATSAASASASTRPSSRRSRPRSRRPARSSSARTRPTSPTSTSTPTARRSSAWTSTLRRRHGQVRPQDRVGALGSFDSIILGVGSGKYDIGVSSFTINDERKAANMISYFKAGTQWVTQKGNPKKVDPNNACGLNIAVQKGTVQVDDLTCPPRARPAPTQASLPSTPSSTATRARSRDGAVRQG